MAYEVAKDLLTEIAAKRVSVKHWRGLGTCMMVRKWDPIRDRFEQECFDFANQYISVKNATPQDTIVNPMAEKQEYAGTWRLLWNEVGPIKAGSAAQGLTQYLLLLSGGMSFSYLEGETCHDTTWVTQLVDQSAPITAPAHSRGWLFRASSSFDAERNTYNGQIQYQYLKSKRMERVREVSSAGITVGVEFKNWWDEPTLPASHSGPGVYRLQTRLNDACLYDGDLLYEVLYDRVGYSDQYDFLTFQTSETHSNASARLDLEESPTGTIIETSSTQNGNGGWATSRSATHGIFRVLHYCWPDPDGPTYVWKLFNATDAQYRQYFAMAMAMGWIDNAGNRVDLDPTRFPGLYNLTIVRQYRYNPRITQLEWNAWGTRFFGPFWNRSRTQQFGIYVKKTSSDSLASEFVNLSAQWGEFVTESFGKWTTGPFDVGNGKILAVRVEAKTPSGGGG